MSNCVDSLKNGKENYRQRQDARTSACISFISWQEMDFHPAPFHAAVSLMRRRSPGGLQRVVGVVP